MDAGEYKRKKNNNLVGGLGKMAKNKSLPAHLQEKDSRGDDHLTLYERHEKPIACRSRPSLSNPRSTNDIVWAFLRANPTLLRFVTNRVLTIYILFIFLFFYFGNISYVFFDIIVLPICLFC